MPDQEAELAIRQIDLALQKLGKEAAMGRLKARETRLKESDAEVWKAIAKPRAPATVALAKDAEGLDLTFNLAEIHRMIKEE
eukprot:8043499-Heterocapsa_arctica.AAC.1